RKRKSGTSSILPITPGTSTASSKECSVRSPDRSNAAAGKSFSFRAHCRRGSIIGPSRLCAIVGIAGFGGDLEMTDRLETLDELLSDPLVQLVMKRDNVRPEELRRSLERARKSRRALTPPPHLRAKACRPEGICAP